MRHPIPAALVAALAVSLPVLAAPKPAAQGGPRDLFTNGITFNYQKEDGMVWAHKKCAQQKCPLVIFLHGSNKPPVWSYPALDERVPSPFPDKKFMVHVGKLAQAMIEQGKVNPLVIAAPTNGGSATPWGSLDLKTLVDTISQTVSAKGVTLDLDGVGVVGHSAAGGYPNRGLDKIAAAGAMFGGHKLRVFGITDTNITYPTAMNYAKGLAKNDSTIIYALHKMGGGWVTSDNGQSNMMFAKGLGATHKMTDGFVGNENKADFIDAYDNDGKSPLRMSIKINFTKINAFHSAWEATGGYKARADKANEFHNDMVPLWAWLALPRFYGKNAPVSHPTANGGGSGSGGNVKGKEPAPIKRPGPSGGKNPVFYSGPIPDLYQDNEYGTKVTGSTPAARMYSICVNNRGTGKPNLKNPDGNDGNILKRAAAIAQVWIKEGVVNSGAVYNWEHSAQEAKDAVNCAREGYTTGQCTSWVTYFSACALGCNARGNPCKLPYKVVPPRDKPTAQWAPGKPLPNPNGQHPPQIIDDEPWRAAVPNPTPFDMYHLGRNADGSLCHTVMYIGGLGLKVDGHEVYWIQMGGGGLADKVPTDVIGGRSGHPRCSATPGKPGASVLFSPNISAFSGLGCYWKSTESRPEVMYRLLEMNYPNLFAGK